MHARNFEHAARRPWWLVMLLAVFMALLSACSDSPAPAPTISVQPSDTSAVAGNAATLSVTASGPDIAYQWQVSIDGGTTWTNVAGATQAGYTTPPTALADSGKRYRVIVSAAGISVNSSAVQLTVTPAVVVPALTVQPAAQTATAPGPATFSVTASGTSPSYQWQRSTDGGATFTDIAGATAAGYSTGATSTTMDGERYRVVVSNSAGSVTSNAVVLTVKPTPVAAAFTTQPTNQSVTTGSAAAFTVVATGTPAPTLQWQRSTDGGSTFSNIAGATDPTFNTGLTTLSQNAERYRAVATNGAGSATSNAATLTVNAAPQAPTITTQATSQTVTAPATATFTATAAGVPTPTWQWQVSSDNALSFANINGATGASYTTPATTLADSGKYFRAVATNASGSASTNAVTLTVNPSVATGWQGPPTPLHADGSGLGLSIPALAWNGAGQAITAWSQSGVVGGARYVSASGWQARVSVSGSSATSSNIEPAVAMNGSGQAVTVWLEAGSVEYRVQASIFTPAGGWSVPATLSTSDDTRGFVPKIAVDGQGNAVAAWVQRASAFSPWQLFASRYDAAGATWSSAQRLDSDSIGEPTDNLQVAMNAAGDAFVLWPAPTAVPGTYSLWARRLPAGAAWDVPALVDAAVYGPPEQRIAVDAGGNAMAVFKKTDNASFPIIWSSRFDALGAAWGASSAVSINNVSRSTSPQIAFDATGQAVAVWVQWDGTQDLVLSRRHTAASGWGTVQQVAAGASNRVSEPSLAVNAGGTAVVAWRQDFYYVAASVQTPGSAWRTPVLAPTTGSDGMGYSVSSAVNAGVDDDGNATIVWLGGQGSGYRVYGGRFR
jgi:hypothetical protein